MAHPVAAERSRPLGSSSPTTPLHPEPGPIAGGSAVGIGRGTTDIWTSSVQEFAHSWTPSPASDLALQRLEGAGFTPEAFRAFLALFVGNSWDFNERPTGLGPPELVAKPGPRGRRAVKQVLAAEGKGPGQYRTVRSDEYLKGDTLVDHLLGLHWIGTLARKDRKLGYWTPFVAVDLDAGPDLAARTATLRGTLGDPSLVFLTPGGGLHCYYLLAHPVPIAALAVVRHRLAAAGLPEAPGAVEVYPNPKGGNPLRLPFGVGFQLAALLGGGRVRPVRAHARWDSAASLTTAQRRGLDARAADLADVSRAALAGTLRTVDLSTWGTVEKGPTLTRTAAAAKARAAKLAPSDQKRDRSPSGRSVDPEAARRFLRDGLTRPKSRKAEQFNALHYLRHEGAPKDEAVAIVWDVLQRGGSETVTRNPKEARKALEADARSVFAWEVRGPLGVTDYTARQILDASRRLAPEGPTILLPSGEAVSRFKYERALFAYAVMGERWVRGAADRALWQATKGRPVEADRLVRLFASNAVSWWPDPSRPLFVVDQPSMLRRSARGEWSVFRGLSAAFLRSIRPLNEASGAWVLTHRRNTWKGRAERFATPLLDMGALSEARHPTVEDMIRAHIPTARFLSEYAGRAYRTLTASKGEPVGTPIAGEESPSGERFIRERLKTAEKSRADLAAAA